mgnify:CR=1 FL=1
MNAARRASPVTDNKHNQHLGLAFSTLRKTSSALRSPQTRARNASFAHIPGGMRPFVACPGLRLRPAASPPPNSPARNRTPRQATRHPSPTGAPSSTPVAPAGRQPDGSAEQTADEGTQGLLPRVTNCPTSSNVCSFFSLGTLSNVSESSLVLRVRRSMSARPRYHRPNRWVWDGGEDVRWAVRTLAQAFNAGARRHDWHDASRKRRQQGRWIWRNDPRWSANAQPRRLFSRVPEQPRGRPFAHRYPGRHGHHDWRDGVLPRRGRPVAVLKAPHSPGQKVLRERQPRGLIPRGTPQGGPERSAEEL